MLSPKLLHLLPRLEHQAGGLSMNVVAVLGLNFFFIVHKADRLVANLFVGGVALNLF